jgi:hypothetical protein
MLFAFIGVLALEILKYSREAHLKARQTEKRIHHKLLYENLYERQIGGS